MESFIAQAKSLATTADEAGRKKMLDTLRDLTYSLESPEDTINRIMFYNLQLAGVRIGIDLKLFELLSESPEPMKLEQLAQKTGAAPVLLGRILRYLASIAVIKETEQDSFTATNVTKTLSQKGFQAGVRHYFDTIGPVFQALPSFLQENEYKDVQDPTNSPFQKGLQTKEPAFVFAQSHPEKLKPFNEWMAFQRHGMPTWLDIYPIKMECKDLDSQKPLLIDIGGGFGHQSIAFRNKYPDLPGRVILQEIPETIKHALSHPQIELTVHDFFQPQPVQGAKYYYLRNILHDWPDEKCKIILGNIIPVMGKDSMILIDEMVLPNQGIHAHATQLDLAMMSIFAAMERTQEQWERLLEESGLRILRVLTYTTSLRDSIIVAVPK